MQFRTVEGLASKVKWPAVALFALGAAMLVAGGLLESAELRLIGSTAIGASGITAVVGHQAPPPTVVPVAVEPGSDALLADSIEHKPAEVGEALRDVANAGDEEPPPFPSTPR